MRDITHILFDLGRVLIQLDGAPPLRDTWLPQLWSEEEKWARWGRCPVVVAYESGKISADDFVTQMIDYFCLEVEPQVFKDTFSSWPKGFLTGAEALLKQLKPNYTLAFYSNTSDLHLPRFMQEIGLANYFDFAFASYEIGHYKPDVAGFRYVQQAMAVDSEQILFLDDLLANVQAAQSMGMQAAQVIGVDAVKEALHRFGVAL